MKATAFKLRVLDAIERHGKLPSCLYGSASRRASLNEMIREKWVEKNWHRQIGGSWFATYKLTPVGVEILHQPELALK